MLPMTKSCHFTITFKRTRKYFPPNFLVLTEIKSLQTSCVYLEARSSGKMCQCPEKSASLLSRTSPSFKTITASGESSDAPLWMGPGEDFRSAPTCWSGSVEDRASHSRVCPQPDLASCADHTLLQCGCPDLSSVWVEPSLKQEDISTQQDMKVASFKRERDANPFSLWLPPQLGWDEQCQGNTTFEHNIQWVYLAPMSWDCIKNFSFCLNIREGGRTRLTLEVGFS